MIGIFMTKTTYLAKTTFVAVLTGCVFITGCAGIKGMVKKDKDVIATAEKSEADYYQDAQKALDRGRNREAITALNNIRTFYPAGNYAQQSLLDLIYAQYNAKEYEAVTNSTAEFIRSYPHSKHIDYALYVQGVTNMDGSPKASRIFKLDQSDRDISYLRLAFADFSNLIKQYPNSIYAPDAAQRMIALYNHFAHHELNAARWYVKRDAYVAAANRAKWVFQYYPQSDSVPEAIAILAYSNEKLGLADTANQYKTLLQINYPQYLNASGGVKVDDGALSYGKRMLSTLTFGKFGRVKDTQNYQSNYTGETYTQIIKTAGDLKLPDTNEEEISTPTEKPQRQRHIGLGLPDDVSEAGHINSTS